MKFKKVEIQAFRAYEEIKNGTFDFKTSNAEEESIADFVSIFAPNGFGKTSFYDAVEYGLTDSIDRFLKNVKLNKEAAKSERQLNSKQKGQYLLRNKDAPDNLDTLINIDFTETDKLPIKKKIERVNRKGTVDFHFSEGRVKNKYFQSVILSQDWIDAFLKVDDPSIRYERFMEYFGDKKLGEYYKKIIELINRNNKKIEALKTNLTGIQQILDFTGDKDILKKVNDKILELNALDEKIKTIVESHSASDSLNLSNHIAERLNEINFLNAKQDELIKLIDNIFSESTEIVGIENYFNSKGQYLEIDKNSKGLQLLLEKFKNKDQQTNELNQVSENQKLLIIEKEKLENILKLFQQYKQISEDISKLEKQIESENGKKIVLNNNVSKTRIIESELKSRLENLNKQITDLEQHIKELPILNKNFIENTLKLDQLKLKISDQELKIKPELQLKIELENEIEVLSNTIQNIDKSLFPSINEKLFFEFKDLIINLEKNEKDLQEKAKELNRLNQEIKDQEILIKDIEIFILKGAEIINKNQDPQCPLCNYEYSSFNELSSKVSNNTLLSSLLSSLLKKRSEIEVQIDSTSKILKQNIISLTNALNKILLEKKEALSNLSLKILNIEENKKNLRIEFDVTSENIQKFNLILKGVSFTEHSLNKNDALIKIKKELSAIMVTLESTQTDLKNKISDLEIIENKIKTHQLAIEEARNNEPFQKISEYYKFKFPNEKIESKFLEQELANIYKSTGSNKQQIEILQQSIHNLEKELKKYTKDSIDKELADILKEKEIYLSNILSFEQTIKTKLKIDSESYNKETLSEELLKQKAGIKGTFEKNELKIKNYNLLISLKQNVEPFLKYAEAKKSEEEIIARKDLLEKKVKKELEKEKNALSIHLKEQIKSFFYEDVINDLYRRIDPHPDYKTIKFDCDFKEDKPKLNVYLLKDEKSEDPIIPNLYFSAAQLNILSLSIFLAKALNAKDDENNSIDCIFIDDPIQSMDSINILSTIDLFRSIMVNQNKQIILSTHDENFHNLLQKKMPPNLFNSKFMELETFGKVKTGT